MKSGVRCSRRGCWVQALLVLGIIVVFPFYRQADRAHQLVQEAKKTGVWNYVPARIPAHDVYIDAVEKQGKLLSLKLKRKKRTITIDKANFASILMFVYRIVQMPALQIEALSLKQEGGSTSAIITIVVPESTQENRIAIPPPREGLFYTPRFFYVNARIEIDGQRQFWVNGAHYGSSCPWPLYHTFDRQTKTVKKGDLRPRLSLTSVT